MRKSGGLPAIRLRSAAGVSPCLTSTEKPSLADQTCNRLSRSRFKALRGVMYSSEIPCLASSWTILSMRGRRAASVFPEPVGAIIRTFSP